MAEEVLFKNYYSDTDYYWYFPLKLNQYAGQKYSFDFSTTKTAIEASNLMQLYPTPRNLEDFVNYSCDVNLSKPSDSNYYMNRYIERGFVNGFVILFADEYQNYFQRTEAFVNQNEIVLPQEIGDTVSGELTLVSTATAETATEFPI